MSFNSKRFLPKTDYETKFETEEGDIDTRTKDFRHKAGHLLRSPNYHDEQPLASTSKPKNLKNPAPIKTMTVLKKQLYNLKRDFSDFFSEEAPRPNYSEALRGSRESFNTKSPRLEDSGLDEFYKYKPPQVSNQLQYLREENQALKGELKRLRMKYENKKEEYKEVVKFMNKKVEYLEEQLQTNEENMMECKDELEREMDAIRQQLTRKKDAEISLEDYGELLEMNSNLKEEMQIHQNAVERARADLEVHLHQAAEMEKQINELSYRNKQIKDKCERLEKDKSQKGDRLENEIKQHLQSKESLRQHIDTLTVTHQRSHEIQINRISQLQKELKESKEIESQLVILQSQNSFLRQHQLQSLQRIGQLNVQVIQYSNDLQITHEQLSKVRQQCSTTISSNPLLEEENLKLRQEVDHVVGIFREIEGAKVNLERQREAMLHDICFFERECEGKHLENTQLRQIVAEREDEIMYLRGVLAEWELKQETKEGVPTEPDPETTSGPVFFQSQDVGHAVSLEFEGILNGVPSPTASHIL